MTACEVWGRLDPPVEILATDISEEVLERARSGRYSQFEVQRGLPIRLLIKYFESQDDTWAISPRIRQMVRWKRINLLADLSAILHPELSPHHRFIFYRKATAK